MCVCIVRRSSRKFDCSIFTQLDSKDGGKAWTLMAAPKNAAQSGEL